MERSLSVGSTCSSLRLTDFFQAQPLPITRAASKTHIQSAAGGSPRPTPAVARLFVREASCTFGEKVAASEVPSTSLSQFAPSLC